MAYRSTHLQPRSGAFNDMTLFRIDPPARATRVHASTRLQAKTMQKPAIIGGNGRTACTRSERFPHRPQIYGAEAVFDTQLLPCRPPLTHTPWRPADAFRPRRARSVLTTTTSSKMHSGW